MCYSPSRAKSYTTANHTNIRLRPQSLTQYYHRIYINAAVGHGEGDGWVFEGSAVNYLLVVVDVPADEPSAFQ